MSVSVAPFRGTLADGSLWVDTLGIVVEGATTPWSWASLPGMYEDRVRLWTLLRDCDCYPAKCDHWHRMSFYEDAQFFIDTPWLISERGAR